MPQATANRNQPEYLNHTKCIKCVVLPQRMAYFKLEHALPRSKSLAAVLHYGAGVTWAQYTVFIPTHVLITHN